MSSASPSAAEGHANALPPGTRLGEFEIRRVIGVGGFGIVYLAFDHGLEREVAIKEYMPSSLASRTATLHVSLTSPSHAETFALGLRSFVNEAKLLARFDHRSLIKVHRFWEDRGTAYMVMPLYRGRTLRDARRGMAQPPDEAWLRGVLDPVLGALEVLHREEVYHRDIAPDNILIGDDNVPMLLDFGAARHVISGRSQTLTAILKPSYAPIEQYGEATNLRQGAWTDLYALGATWHYLITESPPAPATVRAISDDSPPLADTPRPGISPEFLRAVDWMLAPRPADRPQSVAQLRGALEGRSPIPRRVPVQASPTAWQPTEVHPAAAVAPTPPTPAPPTPASAVPTGPVAAAAGEHAAPLSTARAATMPGVLPADRPQPARPAALALPARRSPLPWVVGGAGVVLGAALLGWMAQRPDKIDATPGAQAASAAAPVIVASAPAPAASAGGALVAAPEAAVASGGAGPVGATASTQTPPTAVTAGAAPALVPGAVPASTPVALGAAGASAPARKPLVAGAVTPSGALAPQPASRPATGARQAGVAGTPGTANGALAPSGALTPQPGAERRNAIPANPPAAATNRAPAGTEPAAAGATAARSPEPTPPPSGPRDPREQCGHRVLLALHLCLVRECVKPQYFDHPQCQQVRAIEERTRQRLNGGG